MRASAVRHPLVLFLALGLGIFALDSLRPGGDGWSSYQIEVTELEIDRLRLLWQSQSGRLPSQEELAKLIAGHVREEILYREALRLGLDDDDLIVRRRLAQKMTFLLEDTQSPADPSEEELRRFFDDNRERYRLPSRFSFAHIFFSRETRGASAKSAAMETLGQLRQGEADQAEAGRQPSLAKWRALGDPFMLRREYAHRTRRELVELFGQPFVAELEELEVGSWQGPIASAYGLHLVRLEARTPAPEPDFEQARHQLLEDYRNQDRRTANEEAYLELMERYRITIHGLPSTVPEGERPSAAASP